MVEIYEQGITETLENNYMPYAMSVIVSRAIPEIDGFKPSHRKLLYTMYKMKLLNGSKTKSANVVGQTMKLNPHGDQAIYATLVRLTRGHEALLHPYVDSKGNFGKVTSRDMKFAAPRYTEVKLEGICNEIFKDIDKETVEFIENYDGTMKEPSLLPTTFPNILVNPNKGIAVGMANNMCSFNLREICEFTAEYIRNPYAKISDYIMGPDFSTGGTILYSEDEMQKIYDTGSGTFKIRGKYRYNEKDNCIEIYEIPYTTTIEQIIEKTIDLVKENKIKEILDIRDETDLKGLKIAIDLKKNVDPEKFVLKMFRYTPMEDFFSCNFNILINGRPAVLGIKEILDNWIEFRIGCIKNQLKFDINRISAKIHLLKGLEKVLLDIDRAIEIIRNTESEALVIPNLMMEFGLDEIQSEFVAEIKLRNINKEYILNKTKEIRSLEKELEGLNRTLNSEIKLKQLIAKDLKSVIKKYSVDRKTDILNIKKAKIHNEENVVDDYNLKVVLTKENYFKKISLVSLRSSGAHKLKDDDEIIQEIDGGNGDEILFFSSKSNVYKSKLSEIEDTKTSNLGEYLPNILNMEEDENILFMVLTRDYSGYLIFAFENGKIAKVPLKSYETKTNRKKLVKSYSDVSLLIRGCFILEDTDILIFRHFNDEIRCLLIDTSLIPEKNTKNTKGIQAFRLRKNSCMVNMLFKEEMEFENIERFRAQKIPMSGEELDAVERIKYSSI